MSMPYLTPAIRLRRTPFSRRVEAAGAAAYTVYNHMLLASFFRSVEEDYAHLKRAVQVWDVSCERQVEIVGPDASRLVQLTTPRDLSRMADDQCYYIPMVDEDGRMLNDPILIKLADDRYWVSIADTDMLYYFKGLANGFGLNAKAFEPDVSPLAIQGPKADKLVARVFGQEIVDTKFFRYKTISFQGKEMIIARSGWSHQGGFELYLDGSEYGEPLWDLLFESGKDLDVRAGGPNLIERIEAGLLSYGNDITIDTTPFEAGLGKYCNLDAATDCLGHEALLTQKDPRRQIRSISIDGPPVPAITSYWPLKDHEGNGADDISSGTWSPDFGTNVAIDMVHRTYWTPGTELIVETEDGEQPALVRDSFWI